MSRSEDYKGHEEMIRVWRRVQAQRPDLAVVVIGEGDDRPRLEQLARELGTNVRFLGEVDDHPRDQYPSQCRCFCLPARGEGFGLVYLEAMRAGKAVLAGSRDAGCEIVSDGGTGRTVDPTNSDELLDGILDVSGGRGAEIGRARRSRFEQHFTYARFPEKFSGRVLEVAERSAKHAKSGGLAVDR